MDKNYHYFAVKAIAHTAGFGEAEAQAIATYSQYVDDYNETKPRIFEDVPKRAVPFCIHDPKKNKWTLLSVTTCLGWTDYYAYMQEEKQRNITVPFHFITKNPLSEYTCFGEHDKDRHTLRVEKADMKGSTRFVPLISAMLCRARDQLWIKWNNETIMRIGMLLHIFADTHSHQSFSGFWGWENHSWIYQVKDKKDKKDITKKYNRNFYYTLPSIGHANVNTSPDDSFAIISLAQKKDEHDDKYSKTISKDNTERFLLLSREILDYLRICLRKNPVSDSEWDNIEPQFRQALIEARGNDVERTKKWQKYFPGVIFKYDSNKVLNESLSLANTQMSTAEQEAAESIGIHPNVFALTGSEEFFMYNILAYEIRHEVNYGNRNFDSRERHIVEAEAKLKEYMQLEAAGLTIGDKKQDSYL